ncbi:hypothetical protein [Mycobacterium sp. NPDC006124]|uniref:hypothetical protein n=1 Tax=Mycobacterium sp. NPDC006124 TaxID=3156729 RepID=UPI0033BAC8A0
MPLDDVARGLTESGARTVLVDGRSGSGKTTLAKDLRRRWDGSQILRLDDVYPGWDGLAWAVEHVRNELLAPRHEGLPGRWRSWNWVRDVPGRWHTVDPDQRLIVEGVGALDARSRALADVGIWVETPDVERKQRALLRDGDTYRPHWDRWAAQEEVYLACHDPRSAADWVVTEAPDGSVWTARDPVPE